MYDVDNIKNYTSNTDVCRTLLNLSNSDVENIGNVNLSLKLPKNSNIFYINVITDS